MNERLPVPTTLETQRDLQATAPADLLRAAAEDLDARTASRLNRARQAALLECPRRAYWPVLGRLPGACPPSPCRPSPPWPWRSSRVACGRASSQPAATG